MEVVKPTPIQRARRFSRARLGQPMAYLFVVPALLFFGFFLVYPIVYTIRLSFYEWSGFGGAWKPIGWHNYRWLLVEDPVFRQALRNTLIFVAVQTIVQTVFGLALALVLDSLGKGKTFFRTLFFMPVILSLVLVGLLFNMLYDPNYGLLNGTLKWLDLAGLARPWLSDSSLALLAVAVVAIWQGTGFTMVIYLAGLQNVPRELVEAAKIDGAGVAEAFRHVTWPLLRPITSIVVVLTIVGSFKVFDYVWIMTRGGPAHLTEVLATYLYTQAFRLNHMGVASAIAMVLMVVIMAVSYLQLRIFYSDVEY